MYRADDDATFVVEVIEQRRQRARSAPVCSMCGTPNIGEEICDTPRKKLECGRGIRGKVCNRKPGSRRLLGFVRNSSIYSNSTLRLTRFDGDFAIKAAEREKLGFSKPSSLGTRLVAARFRLAALFGHACH